jgi:Leucine-rich repeat (LRR) protein
MTREEAVRRIKQAVDERLIQLDLSRLGLEEWPREITHYIQFDTHLEKLILSDNQIAVIPETIGQLSCLKWLSLFNNQITSIPKEIGQLSSLKQLYLSYNQITSLPEALGQLSNLEKLYLYGTQITVTEIPQVIRQLPKLKIFI